MNGHTHDILDISLPKGIPFDEYEPPNWDEFFMLKVYLTGEMKLIINTKKKRNFVLTLFSKKIKRSTNKNRCCTCT